MSADHNSDDETDFVDDLEQRNGNIYNMYLDNPNAETPNDPDNTTSMPSQYNHSEFIKRAEKKNLYCVVCGARAFGYNFDQITCESCKAFFRRNALRNTADLQCRFGGNCDITTENRRHCTCCRIKKCFDVGMRKEWIRSEEEKNKKKCQLETFRKRKQVKRRIQVSLIMSPSNNSSTELLSSTHRTHLNNITHCYDQYTGEPSINNYTPPNEVISLRVHDFYNRKKPIMINFISFFKRLPEFQQLNMDDQVLLIKQNLRTLLPVNYALLKTPAHSQFRYTRVETLGCVNSINLHTMYQSLSNNFVPFVTNDPIIMKLFLISLFLSKNLQSTDIDTFEYKQIENIKEMQSNYTELLWLYMVDKYGKEQAVKLFLKIITQFMHLQRITDQIDSIIRLNSDVQHLDSLIKIILHVA